MTTASRRASIPANANSQAMVSAISVLLLLTVSCAVLFIALRSPQKDDIAWLLYVARRWLAGRELYVDVVEVNPPLIVWISAIPLQISRWLNADARFVAIPFLVALVMGCGWWASCLLRRQGGIFARRLPVFAVIGSALLLLPAADIGQREHLMVAAFLPYLVLYAQTLDRRRISMLASVAVGAVAGLGCALKPQYGVTFAALEVLALCRGLRPWRAMPIAAGFTLVGYAGLVALMCPAYLHRAIPMATALYGATNVSFLDLLRDSSMMLCGQAVVVGLLWLRRRDWRDYSMMLTIVVFAAACTIVCFFDGKDWYYHRLPETIVTVLALVLWAATELTERRGSIRWPVVAAAAMVCLFCSASIKLLKPEAVEAVEPTKTAVDRLEQIITADHARTYVAFSEWIALGFPVVNETGVNWASRFDSMWALKGEVWRAKFDPATSTEWPIARWVSHDFIAGCPDIAVVDTRETTNYIQVLKAADPAFVRAWSRYTPIAAFDGLVVYRRGKGGCLDVWVAAQTNPNVKTR